MQRTKSGVDSWASNRLELGDGPSSTTSVLPRCKAVYREEFGSETDDANMLCIK